MKASQRKSALYAGPIGAIGVLGSESRKIISSILNVGKGDLTFSFDKKNPADRIKAARIVKHMLRSGYALLIEVGTGKGKKFTRATDFDENTCEYIIADFDETGAKLDEGEQGAETATSAKGKKAPSKRVAAETTRAIAAPRSSGG